MFSENIGSELIPVGLSDEQLQTLSGGLVVIAIIAILIGMLQPSVQSTSVQK